MAKALYIAEKPSVAQEFAKALKINGQRKDGYLESDDSVVTWCVGHLVTMSYPEKYDIKFKRWSFDLRYSRKVVSNAVHELSPWISHLTCLPGYTPFTPSKSGQRLPPTYYRGCWHVVSRGLFARYRLLLVPDKRSLQPESLLPSRGVAGSGLRPLPNIPHCCLP